jgi:hypothetical protein
MQRQLYADAAYDTEPIRRGLESIGIEPNIPVNARNDKKPRPFNVELYRKMESVNLGFSFYGYGLVSVYFLMYVLDYILDGLSGLFRFSSYSLVEKAYSVMFYVLV